MLPVLFNLGPLVISPLTLLSPLAFIISSFVLWRGLKEDYPEEEIISLTIYLALIFLGGARIVHIITHFEEFQFFPLRWLLPGHYPGFSFFGGFLACLGWLIFWSKRKAWDFWEIAEVLVFTWFVSVALVGAGLYLISGRLIFLGEALLGLVLLPFSLFLKKKYRTFVWYKSGKLGFVSCVLTAIFMLGKLVLEIISRGGLYWEGIFLLGTAVAGVVILYLRSGRSIKEDLSHGKIEH